MPTEVLKNVSPYEKLFGQQPNFSNSEFLAVFVSLGFVHTQRLNWIWSFNNMCISQILPHSISVIKSTAVRLVLEHVVGNDLSIGQLDVNNAFLQATLQDEIYVSLTPGFIGQDRHHHVCRLWKALYGLKQAISAWCEELRQTLLAASFQNSVADRSLFVFKKENQQVYILVYVDDIVVTRKTSCSSIRLSRL